VWFLGKLIRRVLQRDRVKLMPEESGPDPALLVHWKPVNRGDASCGALLGPTVLWTVEGPFANCLKCAENWRGVSMHRFLKQR